MRKWPLHPWLFALFPVLFLFARNAHLVHPEKLLLPLGVVISSVGIALAIARLVFRDWRRAAIATSAGALLVLSYGHFWIALSGKSIFGLVVGRDMFLLPIWGLIGIGALLFAWRVRALPEVTGILNAVAVGLVAVVLVNAGTALADQRGKPVSTRAGERSDKIPTSHGVTTKRDIVYVIFDRYGGASTLKEWFGYDNTPTLDFLRDRGFYVADQSMANYADTTHSLVSSLNLEHVTFLEKTRGRTSSDLRPLNKMFVGPKVTRFLQRQGYTYAHIGSWFDPSAHDPTAQVNYHYDKRSEFTRILVQTTLLRPISKRVGFLRAIEGRRIDHQQILFELESIVDATNLPGPTFTFAHLLLPHEPFTFDAKGNYVTDETEKSQTFEKSYRDQLEFTNAQIRKLVDRLLDRPPAERPIVILQADEGPKAIVWPYGTKKAGWDDAPDKILRWKFPILNAYYLPGVKDAGLYPSITPVNSFRKVFNLYFGTDLRMLPDESYVHGTSNRPYAYENITERLRRR